MTILQFIWQITLICGLVIGLAVGLFSAPWYILGGILLVAFFVTWRLMPTHEIALSQFVDTFNELSDASNSPNPSESPAHPTSQSDATAGTKTGSTPFVLSYRGAPYAVNSASPDQVIEEKAGLPLELKYRGAKVKLKPPQS